MSQIALITFILTKCMPCDRPHTYALKIKVFQDMMLFDSYSVADIHIHSFSIPVIHQSRYRTCH